MRSFLTMPPSYATHTRLPARPYLINCSPPPPAAPLPGNFRDTMASYSTNLRSVLRGLRANLALPVAEAAARVKQQPGGGDLGETGERAGEDRGPWRGRGAGRSERPDAMGLDRGTRLERRRHVGANASI